MATNIGDKLKAWLNFQRSPVEDLKGNTWTSHGNPTIGTANAFNGNALQLDGQSYIKLSGIELGGQDFYIDGWVYVDPASPEKAGIISVVNPTNGYHMFSFRKSPKDITKLDIWINKTADVSVDSGFTSTEIDTASVGQLVHFKLIYRPDVYNFVLCINDVTEAYVVGGSYCPRYTRQKFDIYIGALPNGNQGLIGSIDELHIYDGTWFTFDHGNVPTTSDYNSVYFNADIKTNIHNSLTEWRYENAGYADLLITSGTTVTGLTPTQSKTGTAFYQTSRAKCFDIPSTKEIWIKCDVYCNLTNRWRVYNEDSHGTTGICSQTNKDLDFWANTNRVKTCSNSIIKNQLQTVLLHMVSDSTVGIVEAWLDGAKLYTYTGNVNNGDTFADIYLQSDGAGTFFSNVIISNAPWNIDEDVDLHTYLNVDLARSTSNAVTATFDTSRSLVTTQTVNADTSRNTAVATSLNADSMRNVGKALTATFDTSRKGANAVTFNADTARELASGFKAWLRFDESTTKDEYGNKWTAYNSPAISTTNAAFGKALQLTTAAAGDNGQYIALDNGCTLGGQDFTVDGWAFMSSGNPSSARLFTFCTIFNDNAQKTFFIGQKANTGQLELNYNKNWSDLSANLKGQRFHFAVVYEHSKSLLTFYINGQAVATLNQTFTRTFYQYVFLGRANYTSNKNWLGAIDEFRIDDGLARWTENFTPPTLNDYTNFPLALDLKLDTYRNISKGLTLHADAVRNVSNTATVNFDTARTLTGAFTISADTARIISVPYTVAVDTLRIVTDPTVWRYENYGTADLLSVEGTTVDNLDKSQAIYKTAFYQTVRATCFDIPSTKEIWIKCDTYCNLTDRWRIYNGGTAGSTGICSQTNKDLNFWANSNNVKTYSNSIIENQRQTVLLHMVSDSNAGIVEAWLDGAKLYTYTGNVNNGDAFAGIYLQSDGAGTFFSNIIISPVEIGLHENTTLTQNVTCDLLRFFPSTCLVSLDTARNVLWQVPLDIDTYRLVTHSVVIDADLLSTVIYTVQLNCDAIRTLPHDFILSPVEELGGTPDTSHDAQALTQSIEIRLNEQSLTDEVVIVTVKPIDIMEQVKGQYLDYKYNMRVETCKQRGILNTCTCCSDIDEILYKQLEYTIPDDELWRFMNPEEVLRNFPSIKVFRRDSAPLIEEDDDNSEDLALASTHIATIANIIGKKPILQYADFISTVDITAGGTTYNDLIRSIFGWTARIPQHLINCFLRDDKLYVIQRGYEQNEINLGNLAGCEIVGIDKELMRTIWGSSVWSKTETREVFGFRYLDNLVWSDDEEEPEPASTPKTYTTHGRGGLIEKRIEQHNGVTTTTHYKYDSDDLLIQTDIYVESKDVTTHTETRYKYVTLGDGRKVLEEETIIEAELTSKGWVRVDEKTTKHEYTTASPGQVHHYTTDSEGTKGTVVGNGTGDDRRTPYSKWITAKGHKSLISYTSKQKNYQQQRTIYGLTPFDTSFPVHGDEKLIEITNAIKWLNRKTQETLTINLFDYPHVIDFNDRIVINGKVYYLKGNTALKTQHIVNKQTLALVRWY